MTVPRHTHQWQPKVVDAPFILDGKTAVFVYECHWTEVVESTYSEKHDETFYETGEQCDEKRRFELTTDDDISIYDDENIEAANVEILEINPPNPGSPDGWLVVEHNGQEITYT